VRGGSTSNREVSTVRGLSEKALGRIDRAAALPCEPCSQTLSAGLTKSLDWFPVTAELSSTIHERLRGVLVNARLGVTGRDAAPTG
jgi:hypothetical protein